MGRLVGDFRQVEEIEPVAPGKNVQGLRLFDSQLFVLSDRASDADLAATIVRLISPDSCTRKLDTRLNGHREQELGDLRRHFLPDLEQKHKERQ